MRTALIVQQISRAGLTPAFSAANVDGHAVLNDGQTYLHVKTGNTGLTVTVVTPGTIDGQAIADRAYVIGATSERIIGPFPPATYNQPATRAIDVDFSAVTNVTIGAFRLG